jgi:small subunit ribosomal protein S16
MAVKLRLMRFGKKKSAQYRVVVMDERAPRDGRYIEQIGRYDPRQQPSLVEIDNDRAVDWLAKGAQPTETVEKLLNVSGAMNTMKVRSGDIHVVGVKRGQAEQPKPEQAAAAEEAATESVSETEPEAAASESVEAAVESIPEPEPEAAAGEPVEAAASEEE